jgi:hypothetical protein
MHSISLLLIISILIFLSPTVQGKKRCKPLLEKLHNIQAMQRHGYSVKRGLSLRDREDKARDNWWDCENGRSTTNKKSSGKKAKSTANKKPKAIKPISAGTPFSTSKPIVVKSKYEGEKQRAWLAHYQQPKGCNRPKSIQVFAYCTEDKQTQRENFESQYSVY